MNELIAKIETYAPALAEELSISVDRVYDKLRWYVRVDSIQRLVFLTLIMIACGGYWAVAIKRIRKKIEDKGDYYADDIWLRGAGLFIFYSITASLILAEAVSIATNLIAPDFVIITKFLEMGGIK